jgi:hypothetical protein
MCAVDTMQGQTVKLGLSEFESESTRFLRRITKSLEGLEDTGSLERSYAILRGAGDTKC